MGSAKQDSLPPSSTCILLRDLNPNALQNKDMLMDSFQQWGVVSAQALTDPVTGSITGNALVEFRDHDQVIAFGRSKFITNLASPVLPASYFPCGPDCRVFFTVCPKPPAPFFQRPFLDRLRRERCFCPFVHGTPELFEAMHHVGASRLCKPAIVTDVVRSRDVSGNCSECFLASLCSRRISIPSADGVFFRHFW